MVKNGIKSIFRKSRGAQTSSFCPSVTAISVSAIDILIDDRDFVSDIALLLPPLLLLLLY